LTKKGKRDKISTKEKTRGIVLMKNIEKEKAELKEQICAEIDKYYEELRTGLESKSLKIEDIEQLMKEKKAKLSEMLRESTGKTISEEETEKKSVLNADE
jgi:acyl-CoA reductase-like NAD-dependent aldehyde dehydrogenase